MSEKKETMVEYVVRKSSAVSIPSHPGVYFLIDGNDVVYVGQSVNISNRISQHLKDKTKIFDRYYTVRTSIESLGNMEAYFILELMPKYNKTLPKNSIFFGKYQAMEICDVSEEFLQRAAELEDMKIYNFNGQILYDIEQIVCAKEHPSEVF